eukprot:TRINITY_DN65642_c0_g1_i2.p1 TRINITY_DN65642_c0_g1~~TRINITY_DN65642_c0_g1_i2.p1  ORF type:complete len:412 (-),score=18.64 TRINITY_DN65642_c0_g1_i2:46-1281(-)
MRAMKRILAGALLKSVTCSSLDPPLSIFELEALSPEESAVCLQLQAMLDGLQLDVQQRACIQQHAGSWDNHVTCNKDDVYATLRSCQLIAKGLTACIQPETWPDVSPYLGRFTWRLEAAPEPTGKNLQNFDEWMRMQGYVDRSEYFHWAYFSNLKNRSDCGGTRRVTHILNNLYYAIGLYVYVGDYTGFRFIVPLRYAYSMYGCASTTDTLLRDTVCACLTNDNRVISTGAGLSNSDVEAFVHLRRLLPRRSNAFIIGNAFGYSTLVVAMLFKDGGAVDALDGEAEGACVKAGSWFTRRIARDAGLDVQLTVGLSPGDVSQARRFDRYQLAFIDGLHTNEQFLLDFRAVEPYMTEAAVVVCHDVGVYALEKALRQLPKSWHLHWIRGRRYRNLAGTVLLHRGFAAGTFAMF